MRAGRIDGPGLLRCFFKREFCVQAARRSTLQLTSDLDSCWRTQQASSWATKYEWVETAFSTTA